MKDPDLCNPTRNQRGFTLLEVMAAVLLSAIVITIAVAFQINLGSATDAARERLRTQREAVAMLDRISRDLVSSYFIAPNNRLRPGVNPWIFLTGRDFVGEDKSDRIKFITRNYQPQRLDGYASDLAVVAYYLSKETDRPGYKLMRWREIRMPMEYDPSFPAEDNPDGEVIGENLASFSLTLFDSSGSELPDWDSTLNRGTDSVPVAVKIEISMLDANDLDLGFDPDNYPDNEPYSTGEDAKENDLEIDDASQANRAIYSKLVNLPLRPLDWSFLESEVRSAATGSATDSERAAEGAGQGAGGTSGNSSEGDDRDSGNDSGDGNGNGNIEGSGNGNFEDE